MSEVAGSVDAGNPTPTEPVAAPAEPSAAPAVTTPAEPAAPQATPETPWIDTVGDADLKGWAEKKGLQNGSFENVLGSYHNLEKMMGADKAGRTVTLLNEGATPEEVNEFYTKLGRPEEATGYGIAVPEGGDPNFAAWAQDTFHSAGLSKAQSDAVTAAWAEFVGNKTQQSTEAAEIAVTDATNALKKEWGAAYDANVKMVDQAAAKLGMSEDQLTALNQSMGGAAAMKFVHNLATQIGDHGVDEGDSVNSGVMTPQDAQNELDALMGSKEFQEAWLDRSHPNHRNMVERKAQLARMMTGIAP